MKMTHFDLTNWREHPTNKSYYIFFFKTIEEGKFFENLLQEHKINYESLVSDDTRYSSYVAVHRHSLQQSIKLNNLTIGTFRKPFIPNRSIGYVFIAISAFIIALAIIGYFKNQV
ncbi:MAG TPA: hypothetical protein DDX92_12990 [Flavobacteriales bacterium]|jgi:hypothetical protein|nr:hypothetical protein [Flavobacteriales bacterium]